MRSSFRHVWAVLDAPARLRLPPSPQRDRAVAMVAACRTASSPPGGAPRHFPHCSATATRTTWPWTGCRQPRKETRGAPPRRRRAGALDVQLRRNLSAGSLQPQREEGQAAGQLLTNGRGTPVAVSVFKGNVGGTLGPQAVRQRLERFVLVGDRGYADASAAEPRRAGSRPCDHLQSTSCWRAVCWTSSTSATCLTHLDFPRGTRLP